VLVFDAPSSIYPYVIEKLREIAAPAIAERGFFAAALSGGQTPVGLYKEMAAVEGIDWKRTHIFLADERFVPPTDRRSNFAMIRATLLDAVPIPPGNVHPVPVEGGVAEACALRYAEEISVFFRGRGDVRDAPVVLPRFDLIMLGMGEDGHTASLFPASDILEEKTQPVRAVPPEGERTARITLTLPAINNARNVFFLVTGAAKAEALRRVVEEGDEALPAARVRPYSGRAAFLCDREAAASLLAISQ
jgi:6-phosphogluconolactonase